MTDLLTPEEVKRELADADAAIRLQFGSTAALHAIKQIARLCRGYLTLWDRNKELEAKISKAKKHRDTYQAGLVRAMQQRDDLRRELSRPLA